jgi:hypothetical protein
MALALQFDFSIGFPPKHPQMNNFRRYASLIARPQTDGGDSIAPEILDRKSYGSFVIDGERCRVCLRKPVQAS